ncbi:MAG: hypothetical protein HYZ65_01650 [Burkholderiales bacterium]|nr:hypothetical protein [Burkholderiales bacterium]
MNIRFSYLYCDAGNFKNFGEVVFANPNNLPLEELSAKVKQALLDGMFFDAYAVGVPELFFDDYRGKSSRLTMCKKQQNKFQTVLA